MSTQIQRPEKPASKFDRAIGALDGLPGVIKTAPTTVRDVTPMTGDAQTFIVQTFRQRDDDGGSTRETVFLEHVDENGTTRIAIPPKVVRTILRQHEALAARARSRSAKASAEDRKARGIQPGFMRPRTTDN